MRLVSKYYYLEVPSLMVASVMIRVGRLYLLLLGGLRFFFS
jgi:hypothetical protein